MLTIIGVGHVFRIGRRVERAVVERLPRAVCLELDPRRFEAVKRGPEGRKTAGAGKPPLVYRILSRFQESVADSYGGTVGEEMLAAARAAERVGAETLFIDMDAMEIYRRFWGAMGVRERLKLFVGTVGGVFAKRATVEEELKRYESDRDAYIEEFGEEFPALKRVLIDERNEHMAGNLLRAVRRWSDVVAVVGDGHLPGILRNLEAAGQRGVEVIRLEEIRHPRKPDAVIESGGVKYTYTFSGTEGGVELAR